MSLNIPWILHVSWPLVGNVLEVGSGSNRKVSRSLAQCAPLASHDRRFWWRYDVRCGREESSNLPPCTCFLSVLRSAKLQRHMSNRLDVSTNSNTTPSLLPNCRKLFLSLFYCFCKGRSHIGKTQKRHFARFARNFTISRQNFANVSLTVGPREPIKFFNLLDGGRI